MAVRFHLSRLYSTLWFSKTGYQDTLSIGTVSSIFPNDVALLAPTEADLQHAPACFTAESQAAVMKVNTSKSKAMIPGKEWNVFCS